MINAEKLIGAYLRSFDLRVVSKTPEDTSTSWVRLTQLDGASVGNNSPAHLFNFYLQLDCYAGKAGGLPEASDLADTVFDALAALNGQNLIDPGGVITGTNPNKGARVPDSGFEPARERFISTVTVWAHA